MSETSFTDLLVKKLAYEKRVAYDTGKNTTAAQKDVHRQLNQVSNSQGGNIITGEGVTKSGPED